MTADEFKALPEPQRNGLYRKAAKKHHRDGELEIDPLAAVSCGNDGGAYVQAWIWISDAELDLADLTDSPTKEDSTNANATD